MQIKIVDEVYLYTKHICLFYIKASIYLEQRQQHIAIHSLLDNTPILIFNMTFKCELV